MAIIVRLSQRTLQAGGEAKRIRAADLRSAMQQSPSLRNSLLKYAQAFGVQTAHTAVSNAISRLDHRLARWLLMAHDRISGDVLPLTHEFLSIMLAVRRPGVTDTLNLLEQQSLISCGRKGITVRDRKGLERYVGKLSTDGLSVDNLPRADVDRAHVFPHLHS